MKNILLLHPKMLFYKVPIYNKLSIYLEKKGYKMIIWSPWINDPNRECKFYNIFDTPMTFRNYGKIIKNEKIDIIINTLSKKEPGIFFYYYTLIYAQFLSLPIIYYGHGINLQKDQWWRNMLHNVAYFFYDGIILFSPAEKSKLWKLFHHKITCAYNTLDLNDIQILKTKDVLKAQYKIKESKVILTTGRLQERKKINVLTDIFIKNYKNSPDVAWILVGPELSNEILGEIKNVKNLYYLGPIYEKEMMAEIFYLSDIYCVPGALGLGIVEAIFWGLPVLTMYVKHGPEFYYLKNNYNSLIAKDEKELESMINDILIDDKKRKLLSKNAKKVYFEEATLDKMFEGFGNQLGALNI